MKNIIAILLLTASALSFAKSPASFTTEDFTWTTVETDKSPDDVTALFKYNIERCMEVGSTKVICTPRRVTDTPSCDVFLVTYSVGKIRGYEFARIIAEKGNVKVGSYIEYGGGWVERESEKYPQEFLERAATSVVDCNATVPVPSYIH